MKNNATSDRTEERVAYKSTKERKKVRNEEKSRRKKVNQ